MPLSKSLEQHPVNPGKRGQGRQNDYVCCQVIIYLTGKQWTGEWLIGYLYGQKADVSDGYKAGMLSTELHTCCAIADQQSRSRGQPCSLELARSPTVNSTKHTTNHPRSFKSSRSQGCSSPQNILNFTR